MTNIFTASVSTKSMNEVQTQSYLAERNTPNNSRNSRFS